jgi:hypothetical protein
MDGGSDQWPAIDGTSNHEWDRPKPLKGPPTSGSQNVVCNKHLLATSAAHSKQCTALPCHPLLHRPPCRFTPEVNTSNPTSSYYA